MMIEVTALEVCERSEGQRDAVDDFAASLRKRTSAKKNIVSKRLAQSTIT